jgi:hypothetical protein
LARGVLVIKADVIQIMMQLRDVRALDILAPAHLPAVLCG